MYIKQSKSVALLSRSRHCVFYYGRTNRGGREEEKNRGSGIKKSRYILFSPMGILLPVCNTVEERPKGVQQPFIESDHHHYTLFPSFTSHGHLFSTKLISYGRQLKIRSIMI